MSRPAEFLLDLAVLGGIVWVAVRVPLILFLVGLFLVITIALMLLERVMRSG